MVSLERAKGIREAQSGGVGDSLERAKRIREQGLPEAPETSMLDDAVTAATALGKEAIEGVIAAATGERSREENLPSIDIFLNSFTDEEVRRIGSEMVPLSTRDPKRAALVFKEIRPDAKIEEDSFGNVIIEMNGKRAFVQPPGLDIGDVAGFGSEFLLFTPAAKFSAAGKTMVRRLGRALVADTGTSAAIDLMEGRDVNVGRSLETGGMAVLFEGLSPLAGRAWRAVFKNRRFLDENGRLNAEGRRHAEAAGLDPDDMTDRLETVFAQEARDAITQGEFAEAAAQAGAEEFDIPFSKGQRTGDIPQLGREQATRQGAFGERAGNLIRDFDTQQAGRFEKARNRIQAQFSSTDTPTISRPAQAGDPVKSELKRRADALDEQINLAYGEARSRSARFTGDSLSELSQRVRAEVKDFGVDPTLHPSATKSLKSLASLSKEIQKRSKRGLQGVPFERFETERRRISSFINSAKTPSDRAATIRVKRQLDQWLDDAFDNHLFAGDSAALASMKKARLLRTRRRELFERSGSKDEAGRVIQKMLETDPTAEQVVNYIFGANAIGGKQDSVAITRRLRTIFDADSEAWGAIREAAFLRLTRSKTGDALSPKAFNRNFSTVMNQNATLMNTLFEPNEIALMRRFRTQSNRLIVPEAADNPSKTAFTISRLLRDLIKRSGSAAVFSGKPALGVGLFTLSRTPSLSGRAASGAIKPPRITPRAPAFKATGVAATRDNEEVPITGP